jgi:hypothetical protein
MTDMEHSVLCKLKMVIPAVNTEKSKQKKGLILKILFESASRSSFNIAIDQ